MIKTTNGCSGLCLDWAFDVFLCWTFQDDRNKCKNFDAPETSSRTGRTGKNTGRLKLRFVFSYSCDFLNVVGVRAAMAGLEVCTGCLTCRGVWVWDSWQEVVATIRCWWRHIVDNQGGKFLLQPDVDPDPLAGKRLNIKTPSGSPGLPLEENTNII